MKNGKPLSTQSNISAIPSPYPFTFNGFCQDVDANPIQTIWAVSNLTSLPFNKTYKMVTERVEGMVRARNAFSVSLYDIDNSSDICFNASCSCFDSTIAPSNETILAAVSHQCGSPYTDVFSTVSC